MSYYTDNIYQTGKKSEYTMYSKTKVTALLKVLTKHREAIGANLGALASVSSVSQTLDDMDVLTGHQKLLLENVKKPITFLQHEKSLVELFIQDLEEYKEHLDNKNQQQTLKETMFD